MVTGQALCKVCSTIANCVKCSFPSGTLTCSECDATKVLEVNACVAACTVVGNHIDPTGKFCTSTDCKSMDNNYILNTAGSKCELKATCLTGSTIGLSSA